MCSTVHVLIHCAANVDFNERLDGAIVTNCRGPLRMLKLAERCDNLQAYVHVSTAYVNCNQPSGSKVALSPFFSPQEHTLTPTWGETRE